MKLLIKLNYVKLQNSLWWIWEAAVWFTVCFDENFFFWNFVVSFILVDYFIWSSALLCCFELLIDWWRNRWIELYWYKIFFCGNEVFGCFEELFFAVVFFFFFFQCFSFLSLAPSRKFVSLLKFESWFLMFLHIIIG